MNNNWKTEFTKHYNFMVSEYTSPFNSKEFCRLEFNLLTVILQPLYFAYLNYYITEKKVGFNKEVLDKIVNKWLGEYNKSKFSTPGKLMLETYLLFLLGEYVKNEYILGDMGGTGMGKIAARLYKKTRPAKRVDYEYVRAEKKLPYLTDLSDDLLKLKMEYYHLLHGNRGLSIKTIFMEKAIFELIQKLTNVQKKRGILDLFVDCYCGIGLIKEACSHKTLEKRLERLKNGSYQNKLNRLVELEKIFFPISTLLN